MKTETLTATPADALGLAPALAFTAKQAVAAAKPKLIDELKLPHQQFLSLPSGEVAKYDLPPAPRATVVSTIESLSTAIGETTDAACYATSDKVVVVIDDRFTSHRDDRVTMPLQAAPEWLILTQAAPKQRNQKEFLAFLQDEVGQSILKFSPGLLPAVKKLKFRSVDDQTGEHASGRESMGRAVEMEVAGLSQEQFDAFKVRIPRWRRLEIQVELEVRLVINYEERKLSIKPLGGEVDRAEDAAMLGLLNVLANELSGMPVIHGTP